MVAAEVAVATTAATTDSATKNLSVQRKDPSPEGSFLYMTKPGASGQELSTTRC